MSYRKYLINTKCKVNQCQVLHYNLQCNGKGCYFLWISPVIYWQREALPKADLNHPHWASPLNQPLEVTLEWGHSCENRKLVNFLCFLFINSISYSPLSLVFGLTTTHCLLHKLPNLCHKVHTGYILMTYSERTEKDHFHEYDN